MSDELERDEFRKWVIRVNEIERAAQQRNLNNSVIDLVVALAKALDWPIEAVVEHLVKPEMMLRIDAAAGDSRADFASLYNASLEKRFSRDYFEAIRLAVRAGTAADTPTRRAAASAVESDAHEACGSYLEALRCLRSAGQNDGVELAWRLLIDAKCANILFMQGNRTQAIGTASSVLEYTARIEADHVARLARALALWARAHALRASTMSTPLLAKPL
jgi:tetratricopeptide (TPR) repeat protein